MRKLRLIDKKRGGQVIQLASSRVRIRTHFSLTPKYLTIWGNFPCHKQRLIIMKIEN